MIHQENNFIRRYPPHLYQRMPPMDLIYAGYYFAGSSKDSIYFGNYQSPLTVLAVSSDLKNSRQHKIKLSDYNLPFNAVSIKILNSDFFLTDGTIPCIFIGKIKNWQAKQVQIEKKRFSAFEPISSVTAVIRSRKTVINENTLGIINFSAGKNCIRWNDSIMRKQIDGVFDCDGILNYNKELQKIIYTYYYRNEFSVSDKDLKLQFRDNTIDTTKVANIKIAELQNGDRKMAKPPLAVNRLISTAGKQLFVNSNLRGHFESDIKWKQSTPVDVYSLVSKQYDYSFPVYNLSGKKPNAMFAVNNIVYFIFDKTLIGYKIDRSARR